MLIALVMVFFNRTAIKRQSVLKNNLARIAAFSFDNYKIIGFAKGWIPRLMYQALCCLTSNLV